MATIFAGFDREFGTQQLEHFSHAEMKARLLKVLRPMSLKEIFEMDWPGLISLFYEIVKLAGEAIIVFESSMDLITAPIQIVIGGIM